MTDWQDIALRLGAATLVGALIGLNRDVHNKPSGLRTLSLVALGSALAVMVATEAGTGPNPASPVIQGVLTGIGFLGAGVIVHEAANTRVRGLTTAAAIWLTACMGTACGLGLWPHVVIAGALVGLILSVGGRVEKMIHRRFKSDNTGDGDGDGSA